MKRHRSFIVLAGWLAVVAAGLASQPPVLRVERQGDRLALSAPQFHFLEGKPLERLHEGAAVTYVLTVTLGPEAGGSHTSHVEERFVFSYDLWEEKFSVVQAGSPRRSASRLSAAAAEVWCLDNLALRMPSGTDKPLVVKLHGSVVDDEPQPNNEGLTLSSLIDVLSRKRATAPPHWEIVSAPFRLAELKDKPRH